ncbi:MAG TPA: hypothetical protein VL308_03430 [Gemmatimonadaceae bacterium]|jgi:hypothetical protein|nr:hypothetical protein [Gemmatimonadaceae bacterium]
MRVSLPSRFYEQLGFTSFQKRMAFDIQTAERPIRLNFFIPDI